MSTDDNLLMTPREFVDENILSYLYILDLMPGVTSIYSSDEQQIDKKNDDDIFKHLANKYVPIFIFHSEETYYPYEIGKIIPHLELYQDKIKIANYGQVTEKMLSENKGNNINVNPNFCQSPFDIKDLGVTPVYVKINVSLEYIDLIYILYYAYDTSNCGCCQFSKRNEKNNTFHMVCVRLNVNNKLPIKIFYQDQGIWYLWKNIKKYNNNPIVYISKFSHNMYPFNTTHYKKFGWYKDVSNNGVIWKTKLLQIVSEETILYEGEKSMKKQSWWEKIPDISVNRFKNFFSI